MALSVLKKDEYPRVVIKGIGVGRRRGLVGKICEDLVAVDLSRRGYTVYLPYSPTHNFDFLIYNNGSYVRVQVKCAQYINGKAVYNKTKLKKDDYDVLALVFDLRIAEYIPNIFKDYKL